nr:MAG TPA: replication initiator protein [Caudoviricetes sp.]
MKEKEPFYQVPKSLFRLKRDGIINTTTFFVYMLMLDRAKISYLKENISKFTDEDGEVFFVYAYNSLMEDLNIVRKNEVAKAIQELEKLGFIRSLKKHGKATKYYITSNVNDTTTSNVNDTTTSNVNDTTTSNVNDTLIITNNKNNINKNNINNNNKENVVAGVIRQEIHFLIKSRNIKIDNVLKYCSNLDRIKEVFNYADKNNKADAWIIACLRDNYKLEVTKEKHKKNYDLTFDDI